jgi:hypothetical protein
MVVTRELWRRRGALALRRTGAGFAVESVRPQNFDRPWSPAPKLRGAASETNASSDVGSLARVPRDATPRPEDIEADQ